MAQAADLEVKAAPVRGPYYAEARWFLEGNFGGAWGHYDDVRLLDPADIAVTTSPVSGNFIILNNKSLNDGSFTAGVAGGYFFNDTIFVRGHYQYLGAFTGTGYAGLPAGNARHDLKTSVHALMIGVGADFNFGGGFFVEPVIEMGVGFLRGTGTEGANLALNNIFPQSNTNDFVGGGGLGLGYHMTRAFDVVLNGNYYWMGNTATAVTGTPAPGTLNPGEQLSGKLSVGTLTLTGRMRY